MYVAGLSITPFARLYMAFVDSDIAVVDIGTDAPNLFHAKGDVDYYYIIVVVRPQCRYTLKATCCRALGS